MKHNQYIYNTFLTSKLKKEAAGASQEKRVERRGRPKKNPLGPIIPDYVDKLPCFSSSQIAMLVCAGIVLPIYIEDWSKFSDLDKARIIVKYPQYFCEFRNPYVSSFSSLALTYLIVKVPVLVNRIHTLEKLSVAEWGYILEKHPHLIEDCSCRDNLSIRTWMKVILNYDFAHCVFTRWGELTKAQWQEILKKRPNYIFKFCSDKSILSLAKAMSAKQAS